MRSGLEFSAPAWAGAVTQEDIMKIERVQKCAFYIVLGNAYESYQNAMHTLQMNSLEVRQKHICLRFAKKACSHTRFKNWFVLNINQVNTTSDKPNYKPVKSRKRGYTKSQ